MYMLWTYREKCRILYMSADLADLLMLGRMRGVAGLSLASGIPFSFLL